MIRKILRRLGWQPALKLLFPCCPKPIRQPSPPRFPTFPHLIGSHRELQRHHRHRLSERRARCQKTGALRVRSRPLAAPGSSPWRPWDCSNAACCAPVCRNTGQNLPPGRSFVAIPCIVASGLLSAREKIYVSLRPSFYCLPPRWCLCLLALLRIPRPEALKELSPRELGPHAWVWSAAGSKTCGRKLARRLAPRKGSFQLRPGDRSAAYPRNGHGVCCPLRRGPCTRLSWQTQNDSTAMSPTRLSAPRYHRLLVNAARWIPCSCPTGRGHAALTRCWPIVLRDCASLFWAEATCLRLL